MASRAQICWVLFNRKERVTEEGEDLGEINKQKMILSRRRARDKSSPKCLCSLGFIWASRLSPDLIGPNHDGGVWSPRETHAM